MGCLADYRIIMGKRNPYLDVVKGIAIISVILGHSIQYGNGLEYFDNGSFFDNIVFQFIYSFHMPLFMLISGYLFYYSIKRRACSEIIRAKCRSLLLPIFTFAIIAKCGVIISFIIGISGFEEFTNNFLKPVLLNYHLWFLWAVLLNSIIVLVVHKIHYSIAIYALIWLLFLFIPSYRLPPVYSFVFPFFVIGYMANKHNVLSRIVVDKKLLLIVSAVFISLFFFYDKSSFVYTTGQCILRDNWIHYFALDLYRFAIGLIGSIFILSSIYYCYQHFYMKMSRIFSFLSIAGLYSMGLYCFQDLLFLYYRKFALLHIEDFVIQSPIATFLLISFLSYLLTHYSRKLKLTNILLLGGR